MIRHVVLFKFRQDAPEDRIRYLLAEYDEFPRLHPGLHNFSIGRKISERDQTFEWGFSADFETEAELKAYLNSDPHEQHVVERFRPLIERRANSQLRRCGRAILIMEWAAAIVARRARSASIGCVDFLCQPSPRSSLSTQSLRHSPVS